MTQNVFVEHVQCQGCATSYLAHHTYLEHNILPRECFLPGTHTHTLTWCIISHLVHQILPGVRGICVVSLPAHAWSWHQRGRSDHE